MKLTEFLASEFEILLETGLDWLFGFPFSVDITKNEDEFFIKVEHGRDVKKNQCLVKDAKITAKDLGQFVLWLCSKESNVLLESEIDDLLHELKMKLYDEWTWNWNEE